MDFEFHGQLAPLSEAQMLWDVVEEHMEEASFLWTEWERALVSPVFTLPGMSGVEQRVSAHLEGLALGGAITPARLARAATRASDAGSIFAVTHALLHRGLDEGTCVALELLTTSSGQHRAAARRAFELAPAPRDSSNLERLLHNARPLARAAALDRARVLGLDPGTALGDALGDPDAEVRCAALAAAAFGRRREHRDSVRAQLVAAELMVRDEAICAGMILGVAEAVTACRIAIEAGTGGRKALLLLAIGGTPADVSLLITALSSTERHEDALWALGFTRTIEAADACVSAVGDSAHGPVAAEAFGGITGIDLIQQRLARPAPPPPADLDDVPDLGLELRPEAALPVPDPARILAFWAARRASFLPRSTEPEALLKSLARAPMRRRHALATELAIITRGALLLDTRTWARSQLDTRQRLHTTGMVL